LGLENFIKVIPLRICKSLTILQSILEPINIQAKYMIESISIKNVASFDSTGSQISDLKKSTIFSALMGLENQRLLSIYTT